MQDISLLNSVIGPVLHGPSSSHSAAPYFIANTIRHLVLHDEETLLSATIIFDPSSSFAPVYTNQGTDEGFAAGLWGEDILSENYRSILPRLMNGENFILSFLIEDLSRNDHPNRVELRTEVLQKNGIIRTELFRAISTGGGMFIIDQFNGTELSITGGEHVLIIEGDTQTIKDLTTTHPVLSQAKRNTNIPFGEVSQFSVLHELTDKQLYELEAHDGIDRARFAPAMQLPVASTERIITSAAHVIETVKGDLADYALACETRRLGITTEETRALFEHRCQIMLRTVNNVFSTDSANRSMYFLSPSATKMKDAPAPPVIANPFIKNAAAAAVAVMEANANHDIVVAAPTAGSSGVVPGILYALTKEGVEIDRITDALQVMALAGALFAVRGSFGAETGGCAVETGASAAMAAAGLTYLSGGTTDQVFQAASLCIMNTLGLVCDPVGGEVEIPCHARNIAATGHAQSASIAVLSGFKAVMEFDELVDSTVEVGNKMHPDLRCTVRGGCAITPKACSFFDTPEPIEAA